MPLALPPSQKEIHAALFGAYPSWPDLSMLGGLELGRNFEGLKTGGSYKYDLFMVLQEAEANRWLVELLDAAARDKPGVAELKRLRDAVAASAARASIDPYETPLVVGNRCLFARKKLRRTIRGLNDSASERVFVVKGPTLSGKSHTRYFISYLAERFPDIAFVEIDLKNLALDEKGEVGVTTLATAIAKKLGPRPTPDIPPGDDKELAYGRDYFVDHLAESAVPVGSTRWMVFDGFGQRALSPGAKALIEAIAAELDGGRLVRTRLILLGYEIVNPGVRRALDDLPPEVNEDEIIRLFAAVQEHHGWPPDPEAAGTAARDVLARAATAHGTANYLLEVARHAEDEIRRMQEAAP